MEENITSQSNQTSPTQIPSTQPSNPHYSAASHLKKYLIVVFIIVFLIAGTGTYFVLNAKKTQKQSTPVPQTNNPTISPTPTPDPTTKWNTYTDPSGSYSINYPTDIKYWTNCKYYDPESKFISSLEFSPKFVSDCNKVTDINNYAKLFLLHINVENNPKHLNTESVVKQIVEDYKSTINTSHPNFTNENRSIEEIMKTLKHYTFGKIDALSYPQVCDNCSGEYFIMATDNRIFNFIITGSDEGSINPMTQDEVDHILSTFKFTTPAITPDPQNQTTDTSNWKTYTNTQYGFSFKYPENYSVNNQTMTYTADMLNHVVVSLGDSSRAFGFNTTLGIYKNTGKMTPKDFIKTYFNKGNNDAADQPIDPDLQKVTITDKNYNGIPFTIISGLQTIRGAMGPVAVATKVNDTYFFISETSTDDIDELSILDQILSTFKFTD